MSSKLTHTVGLIGYNFMGKAHSNAWRQLPYFFESHASKMFRIRLKTICGRHRAAVAKAAAKLGWESFVTDWRRVIGDPEIDIVDICTPNDSHCEIAVAAAQAGKAILCEKPLARNVEEAEKMVQAVRKARVANMVCHNYRRVPAIALARQMIERGELGDRIFHFRARYAQDWLVDPNFPLGWRLQSKVAGSGALGDLLSHVVDLARYLVGEFKEVCAMMETFVKQRPNFAGIGRVGALRRPSKAFAAVRRPYPARIDVDDAVTIIGRFKNGAVGSLEATRFAPGRKNSLRFEINGSAGSLEFDLEEMNHLKFYSMRDLKDRQAFRHILVTARTHPYMVRWWPPGHIIGWEHTFVHTVSDFVNAISAGESVDPTFQDGLQNERVLAAVARSAKSKCWSRT